MTQPIEPTQKHQDAQDGTLDADELKTLAKFFDALMEADFELNRKKGSMQNDNHLQTT
jgi:hypothetical protein